MQIIHQSEKMWVIVPFNRQKRGDRVPTDNEVKVDLELYLNELDKQGLELVSAVMMQVEEPHMPPIAEKPEKEDRLVLFVQEKGKLSLA